MMLILTALPRRRKSDYWFSDWKWVKLIFTDLIWFKSGFSALGFTKISDIVRRIVEKWSCKESNRVLSLYATRFSPYLYTCSSICYLCDDVVLFWVFIVRILYWINASWNVNHTSTCVRALFHSSAYPVIMSQDVYISSASLVILTTLLSATTMAIWSDTINEVTFLSKRCFSLNLFEWKGRKSHSFPSLSRRSYSWNSLGIATWKLWILQCSWRMDHVETRMASRISSKKYKICHFMKDKNKARHWSEREKLDEQTSLSLIFWASQGEEESIGHPDYRQFPPYSRQKLSLITFLFRITLKLLAANYYWFEYRHTIPSERIQHHEFVSLELIGLRRARFWSVQWSKKRVCGQENDSMWTIQSSVPDESFLQSIRPALCSTVHTLRTR